MKALTPKEALAIYHAGPEMVVQVLCEFSVRIVMLEERVKALEEQLAQNSRNSSKPPSSDGLNKPNPISLRTKSQRKTGGQKGHQGYTLQMVENPDQIKVYTVDECAHCKRSLSKKKADTVERRQVFDLPEIKLEVIEHIAEIKKCPNCGQINKGEFPIDVLAPIQYGQRIKAIALYLKGYQLLPSQRSCEILSDLFSCPLSEGTLDNIFNNGFRLLQWPVAQIKEQLKESSLVHFDETGISVTGQNHWLHVASTQRLTYYEIHAKRGSEAMDDIGILPNFHGRAIHDFWKPYLTYDNCKHGLCNAHHLRELLFLYEEQQQGGAKNMIDCLLDIKKTVDEIRNTRNSLGKEQRQTFEERYQHILDEGYTTNPLKNKPFGQKKRGLPKKSKARNLLERLDKHRKKALAFMYDFDVPFDNNLVERDVRMAKVKEKISGTFRSQQGAKAFYCIRSYISTVRKNAFNVLDVIENVFKGKTFIPFLDTS